MKKELIIGALAVIVLVGTGIWLVANASTRSTETETGVSDYDTAESHGTGHGHEEETESSHEESYIKADPGDSKATITYTNNGFEPRETTIRSGDAITLVNTSTIGLELALGDHEDHKHDPELTINEIKPGERITVKLSQIGIKQIHNHHNAADSTTITVTE